MKINIICKIKGHNFISAKQYFLKARECTRCGTHQVLIPETGSMKGGWTNETETSK